MSESGLYFTITPASFFQFPSPDDPIALPPYHDYDEPTLKSPFPIDPQIYRDALDIRWPATVAAGYFFFTLLLSQINRRNGFKPWWISTTKFFFLFQVLHNVFLAVYSAVTFVAIGRAIWVSFPGLAGGYGVVGAVDSFCKMNGPRGFGDAITYDASALKWQARNALIRLDPTSLTPDPTDVGRIWNEGLAFWGWLFYLSKLYEIVDTWIILMKGKRATTLQTYHHIGAMFSMWAGIKWMSPPIVMFVFINSFIHTLMYTFYTATTLGFKVPPRLKQTITTLQIMQLLFGMTWAAAHLFISYDVPVSKPYKVISMLASAVTEPELASEIFEDAKEVARSAGPIAPWVKRLIYRAAGAEGLAESVRDSSIYTDRQAVAVRYGLDPHEVSMNYEETLETKYTTQFETINCLETPGEAFAIWLNIMYFIPLTILFLRFFILSYIRKGSKSTKTATVTQETKIKARRLSESINEAARATVETVEKWGSQGEESLEPAIEEATELEPVVEAKVEQAIEAVEQSKPAEEVKKAVEAVKDSEVVAKTKEVAEETKAAVAEEVEKATEAVKDSETVETVKETVEEAKNTVAEKSEEVAEAVKESETVKKAEEAVEEAKTTVVEEAEKAAEVVKDSSAVEKAEEVVADTSAAVSETVESASEAVADSEVAETISETVDEAKDALSQSEMEGSFVKVAEHIEAEKEDEKEAEKETVTEAQEKDENAEQATQRRKPSKRASATSLQSFIPVKSKPSNPETSPMTAGKTNGVKPTEEKANEAQQVVEPSTTSAVDESTSDKINGEVAEDEEKPKEPEEPKPEASEPATYAEAVKEDPPADELSNSGVLKSEDESTNEQEQEEKSEDQDTK